MWCLLFFPWCCGVDSPPMSPSLLYLKPLRNSNTFLHVIYKSKKKTNLLCILNNVFQYSKIRTRKRNAKKSIKTEKNLESSPFWNPESTELESGIQYTESGIHRVAWTRYQFPFGYSVRKNRKIFSDVPLLPEIFLMERSKKSRLRGRRSRAQILPAPSPDPLPLLTQTLPRSLQKVVFRLLYIMLLLPH